MMSIRVSVAAVVIKFNLKWPRNAILHIRHIMKLDDLRDRNKPENCRVLSQHSNYNKTNILRAFQVHNLLTAMLLLSTFLSTKSCKIKKNVKNELFIFKNVKRFFLHLCFFVSNWSEWQLTVSTAAVRWQTLVCRLRRTESAPTAWWTTTVVHRCTCVSICRVTNSFWSI